MGILDHFDALNPPIISISPYISRLWLRYYRLRDGADFRKFRAFLSTPPPPLWTKVRTSSNVVSKPLWCTESMCHLHLSIAPLVGALLTKSAPISKISSIFVPPTTTALNYNQNFLKDEFQTSFMRWIALSSPFVHISFGCCTTLKVGADFRRFRAFLYHPPPPPPTTIRTSWKTNSRPLWCAKSTCAIHLSIAALVVE